MPFPFLFRLAFQLVIPMFTAVFTNMYRSSIIKNHAAA